MDPINPIAGNPEALNPAPVAPQPPKDNHGITIAAMAVFVLLSLAAVAFLYYQNQQLKAMLANFQGPTSAPIPVATADPTANWKTYTNTKYGFSFKYPATLSSTQGAVAAPYTGASIAIQSFSDPTTIMKNTDAAFDGFSLYVVTDKKATSFENYLQNEKTAMDSSEMAFMAGAVRQNLQNGAAYIKDVLGYYYLPSSDGKTIIVFAKTQQNETFKTTFDQILSTFKFTSPSPIPSANPVSSPSAMPNTIY